MSASDDVWTVQRILQWTADYLKGRGVESARLEAELMLAHARQCQRIRLYTDFTSEVTGEQRAAMREMVQRRARREPLAYIIGEREFYGRPFHVGPGVLIPRPETERLVDFAVTFLGPKQDSVIADVGCGSGCIAVTLALSQPHLRVLATDISDVALTYASRNVERHKVTDRVTLLKGDLLQPIVESGITQLDGLVSNPPYIRDSDMAELEPEVAEYEPGDALVAGPDGLDVVRRLIDQSLTILRPGGFILMEVDPAQTSEVARLLEASGYIRCQVRQDLNRQDRVVEAVRK